jgi:hypothetical protein
MEWISMGKKISMGIRILFIVLTFVSCQKSNKQNIDLPKSTSCSEMLMKEKLIQSAIDLPKLQKYYKVQDKFDQHFLVIQSDSLINNGMVLEKFGLPVKLLTKEEIAGHQLRAYIEFKELKIRPDSATILIKYAAHGIALKASFKNESCNWSLIRSSLWEY